MPEQLSPVTLAFLGDAVYELLVRTEIVKKGSMPAGKLHTAAIRFVSAKGQAKAMALLESLLSEEEHAIFLRGRNANHVKPPKNADPNEYRIATGMEALFGYLFLYEKNERILELFRLILEKAEEQNGNN